MNNNLSNHKTCILYFTRGKSGVKSFSSSKRKSNAVQRLLFSKTLSEIRKSKLDYKISNGEAYGDDVLERLNGAVTQVFASVYANVIVVGDDTPELSLTQIQRAEESLQIGKICIGPAKDGGTYLMAFGKSDFQKGILQNLKWHSNNFKNDLLKNVKSAGLDCELLDPLDDLDTALDLSAFLSRTFSNPFFSLLKNLFFVVQISVENHSSYTTRFFEFSYDRGPPQMI